jgi:rhodanese-related sulfurtransferase
MGQLVEFAARHPLLVAGLLAAGFAVVFYELRLRGQGLSQISAADAVRLINKGALVVDVRKAEEFQTGHIVGARNVAFDRLEQDSELLNKKKKNRVVLTICESGLTSAKAANVLRKAGYEAVFSLKSGLSGWRSENLPLVK